MRCECGHWFQDHAGPMDLGDRTPVYPCDVCDCYDHTPEGT